MRGTVAELGAAGHAPVTCRLTVEGDLEQGSGLSSSAAIGTALALALLAVADADEPPDRRDLARLCSRVENDWVGAETGLLDQLAALFGEPGHAVRIDFATLALERVPLALGDWQLVTLGSGASHSHASSGYNDRRRECREACAALAVGSLSEARAEDVERLSDPLRRRARHVLTENARVDAMVGALAAGDRAEAGRLLDASHASLRDDYEASVPAVERTVAALKAAGAAGARMVGGGFGGSVLALLPPASRCPRARSPSSPGPPPGCSEPICSLSGRSSAQATKNRPMSSIPMPPQRLMFTPAALSISSWLSNRPRTISSRPSATNRPPMMRRRSNRLAA